MEKSEEKNVPVQSATESIKQLHRLQSVERCAHKMTEQKVVVYCRECGRKWNAAAQAWRRQRKGMLARRAAGVDCELNGGAPTSKDNKHTAKGKKKRAVTEQEEDDEEKSKSRSSTRAEKE